MFGSKNSWRVVSCIFRFRSENFRVLSVQDSYFRANIGERLSFDESTSSAAVYYVCGCCSFWNARNSPKAHTLGFLLIRQQKISDYM